MSMRLDDDRIVWAQGYGTLAAGESDASVTATRNNSARPTRDHKESQSR